jgi:hypothetical protein
MLTMFLFIAFLEVLGNSLVFTLICVTFSAPIKLLSTSDPSHKGKG